MAQERNDEFILERERFKQAMIAANPSSAQRVFNLFDAMESREKEEALDTFIPQGQQEIGSALEDLKRFGISLRDDGDV
jgi:hypothetical protein